MSDQVLVYLLIGTIFLIYAVLTSKQTQEITKQGFFTIILCFSLFFVFWYPLFVVSFIAVIQKGKKENEK